METRQINSSKRFIKIGGEWYEKDNVSSNTDKTYNRVSTVSVIRNLENGQLDYDVHDEDGKYVTSKDSPYQKAPGAWQTGTPSAPRSTGGTTTRGTTGSTGGVDTNYFMRDGETAEQYNRRVAEYNASRSGSTGATPMPTVQPTGNSEFDAMLGSLEEYLNELEKRGQVLNPNIKIDAKTVAQFTKQAEQEINPYYKGQLKMARESLLANAGFSRDEVLRTEQELERQYQQNFRQVGESAADRGFALSGIRNREEGDLATATQQTLDQNRRNLQFKTENAAREFAQLYGTDNMPSLSIGAAPSITGGETGFTRQGSSRNLYQLDPNVYQGLIGSQEFERRGAVRNRTSQLESAFRGNQALTQARSLTL